MSRESSGAFSNLSSVNSSRTRYSNRTANRKTALAQQLFLDPMFNDYTESAFEHENTRQKAILEKHRQRYYAQKSLENATKRNKQNKRRNNRRTRRSTRRNRS